MNLFLKTIRQIGIFFSVVFCAILFYSCPFKYLTGLDCPGCGLTRAFLSAFRLDFKAAFNYHPLFLLIGIELLYLLFGNYFKLKPKTEAVIGIITVFSLLFVWIYRQFL